LLGDFAEIFSKADGFDFTNEVNNLGIEGFPQWSSSGTNGAGMYKNISVAEDGTVSFDWKMYATQNSGSDPDACVFILFKKVGDAFEYISSQGNAFEDGSKQALAGTCSWDVSAGEYVVMAFVLESGGNSGGKTLLTIDGGAITCPEGFIYTYSTEGNVIANPVLAGTLDGFDNIDGDVLSDAAVISLWSFINPYDSTETPVRIGYGEDDLHYTDGKYTYEDTSNNFSITFYEDGRYEFTMTSLTEHLTIDGFNITYTVEDQGLSDSAHLYIRTDDVIITTPVDGVFHGTEYNDITVGSDGDDIFYLEAGGNIIYGGGGNDTFIFTRDAVDENNIIKDFSVQNDVLDLFDLLQGLNKGHDGQQLFNDGTLTLGIMNEAHGKAVVTLGIDGGVFATIYMDGVHFNGPDNLVQQLFDQLVDNNSIIF
jgi:hypothetical protein